MPQYPRLTEEQIAQALNYFEPGMRIAVTRIRYRNKDEIRSSIFMSIVELMALVTASIKDEHLPGGDLEVSIPKLGQTLVGHHDGAFWLEPTA